MRHEPKSPEAVADVDGDKVLALPDPVAEVVVGSSTELQATTLGERRIRVSRRLGRAI